MPISQEVNMLYRHFLVSVRWGIKNTINFIFHNQLTCPGSYSLISGKAKYRHQDLLTCNVSNYQIKWSCGEIKSSSYNSTEYHEGLIFKSSCTCDCALYLYHREIKMIFGFGRWKSLTFSVTIIQCNFSSLSATQLIGL